MRRTTQQEKARLMAAAFAKHGAVGRATNAEVRQAVQDLSETGQHDMAGLLICEVARRKQATRSLIAALNMTALSPQ